MKSLFRYSRNTFKCKVSQLNSTLDEFRMLANKLNNFPGDVQSDLLACLRQREKAAFFLLSFQGRQLNIFQSLSFALRFHYFSL